MKKFSGEHQLQARQFETPILLSSPHHTLPVALSLVSTSMCCIGTSTLQRVSSFPLGHVFLLDTHFLLDTYFSWTRISPGHAFSLNTIWRRTGHAFLFLFLFSPSIMNENVQHSFSQLYGSFNLLYDSTLPWSVLSLFSVSPSLRSP